MRYRNDNQPRLKDVDRRVREGSQKHASDAVWQATMRPGRTFERRLVDPSEGGFCFAQESLAKTGNARVVPSRGLDHFGRGGEDDFSHDEPTIGRELELVPPQS